MYNTTTVGSSTDEDSLEYLRMSRRQSLGGWPMPNLKEKSNEMKNNQSTPPPPSRQTISDLKKKQNGSLVRRKSSVTEGKISFKETLLRRRRSSSVRTSINQNAYLEIIRDLSIEEQKSKPQKQKQKHSDNYLYNIPNYGDCVKNNSSTGDCSQYDGEPLTLAHEEDDTLFDDITDAISSL
jgi:hypothetical protein